MVRVSAASTSGNNLLQDVIRRSGVFYGNCLKELRRLADNGMKKGVTSFGGQMARAVARFTAADEAVVASISVRLRAHAFVVERDASTDPDCYWICREQSSNPIWVLLRTEDGLYQLRDELLGIQCQGESLLEILPAGWISTLTSPDCGAVVSYPMGNADHGSDPLESPVARLGAYH